MIFLSELQVSLFDQSFHIKFIGLLGKRADQNSIVRWTLDIEIGLKLGLSEAIYDVLVDDDPQSSHQKGEIDLHGNTVSVEEFIGDRKL